MLKIECGAASPARRQDQALAICPLRWALEKSAAKTGLDQLVRKTSFRHRVSPSPEQLGRCDAPMVINMSEPAKSSPAADGKLSERLASQSDEPPSEPLSSKPSEPIPESRDDISGVLSDKSARDHSGGSSETGASLVTGGSPAGGEAAPEIPADDAPKPVKAPRPNIWKLLRMSETKKLHLVLASSLAAISAILSLAPYVLAAHILGLLLGAGEAPPYSRMLRLGILTGALAIARYLLLFASIMCSHLAAFEILYQTRLRLCAHLGKLSMGWLGRRRSGQVKKILSEDVEEMEQFIAHHIPDIVTAIIQPLAVVACMAFYDWRMALAALVPIPVALTLQRMVFGRDVNNDHRSGYHDVLEDLNGAVVEYVRGMPVVKIFGLTADSFATLREAALAYEAFVLKITLLMTPAWAVFVVVTSSGLALLLPVGIWLHLAGSLDLPTLALFLMLGAGYMRPVFKLAMLGGTMGHIAEGLFRIEDILAEPPMEVSNSPKSPERMDVEFDSTLTVSNCNYLFLLKTCPEKKA